MSGLLNDLGNWGGVFGQSGSTDALSSDVGSALNAPSADNGLLSTVQGWGDAVGNTVLGSGKTAAAQQNALFSSGWAQILANVSLIIVGFVIFSSALKVPSAISTTVNVVKGAGKAALIP